MVAHEPFVTGASPVVANPIASAERDTRERCATGLQPQTRAHALALGANAIAVAVFAMLRRAAAGTLIAIHAGETILALADTCFAEAIPIAISGASFELALLSSESHGTFARTVIALPVLTAIELASTSIAHEATVAILTHAAVVARLSHCVARGVLKRLSKLVHEFHDFALVIKRRFPRG